MPRLRKLPARLSPFFWDCRFAGLSWQHDRDFIIARVLQQGDFSVSLWLMRRAGIPELRSWFNARKGRGLSPRRLSFWTLILGIPRPLVKRWLQEQDDGIWNRRVA
jgi:hypothetical protein